MKTRSADKVNIMADMSDSNESIQLKIFPSKESTEKVTKRCDKRQVTHLKNPNEKQKNQVKENGFIDLSIQDEKISKKNYGQKVSFIIPIKLQPIKMKKGVIYQVQRSKGRKYHNLQLCQKVIVESIIARTSYINRYPQINDYWYSNQYQIPHRLSCAPFGYSSFCNSCHHLLPKRLEQLHEDQFYGNNSKNRNSIQLSQASKSEESCEQTQKGPAKTEERVKYQICKQLRKDLNKNKKRDSPNKNRLERQQIKTNKTVSFIKGLKSSSKAKGM